jgi:cytochrome P450
VIHRSERYFPDPLRFDPGRFEPEARRDRPKYAYFPFGGGPRVCIGQALAKLQMPLVLAMVLQRFRFTLIEGQKITPQPRITLSPSPGIRVKLCRRL